MRAYKKGTTEASQISGRPSVTPDRKRFLVHVEKSLSSLKRPFSCNPSGFLTVKQTLYIKFVTPAQTLNINSAQFGEDFTQLSQQLKKNIVAMMI